MKLRNSLFSVAVLSLAAFAVRGQAVRSAQPDSSVKDPSVSKERLPGQQTPKNTDGKKTEAEKAAGSGEAKPTSEDLAAADNLFQLGSVALQRWDLAKAEEYFRQSLAIQEKLAPGSLALAKSLNGLGDIAERQGYPVMAEDNYLRSLDLSRKLSPDGLDVAMSLQGLGNVAMGREDLEKGGEYLLQALAIVEKRSPDSLELAAILNNLAQVYQYRNEIPKAEELLRRALAIERKLAPDSLAVAASLTGLGALACADAGKAEAYLREGLALRERSAPNSLVVANSLGWLGVCLEDAAKSEEMFRQALAVQERLAPDSLLVARSLRGLSRVVQGRGEMATSEEYERRALAIHQKVASGSLLVARSLANLSEIFASRGDLAGAEKQALLALAICERLGPGTETLASSLSSLGSFASQKGDLDGAEKYYRKALAIREKLGWGDRFVAVSLRDLGHVAEQRGDLLKAEEYQRRALEIRERLVPDSLEVANSLYDLGLLAQNRSDLDRAEGYYRRALALWEKTVPGTLYVAYGYMAFGDLFEDRGDRASAETYYRRALAISEKIVPDSSYAAWGLSSLGKVVRERGNPAEGEKLQHQALAIQEKITPGTPLAASILVELGHALGDRGDLPNAEECYRQALGIDEKSAPGTSEHAEVLAALAGTMRRKNQLEEAAQLYERALSALEDQTSRLGGRDELRSGFRANHAAYYKDFIGLLVAQKRPELAFQVLERFHARTLLETLSTAKVDLRATAGPALAEQSRSLQQVLTAKSEQRVRLLSEKHTEAQLAALNKEVGELLSKYKELEDHLRASSPSYRELTQPQPLSAKDVQQDLLDGDTMLLEYSLGEERSYVFAVTQTTVNGYELAKRPEIERAARLVYNLLTARNRIIKGETLAGRESRLVKLEAEFDDAAATLSRLVLGPVAEQINGKGMRLLIVSDGALQYIPFAALPVPGTSAKPQRQPPLVAEHEIVNLPSASVLEVLRRMASGRKTPPKAVAVLADPVFAKDDARVQKSAWLPARKGPDHASQGVSSSLEHLSRSVADVGVNNGGPSLPRLRFTRREADAITAITRGQVSKALDFQANRAAATSPDLAQYRIVHFATHGLLDSEHPEFSGLVLSLVDQQGRPQNGFLELQDIYNLDLPVDLVVLSACETGLGKDINGEGIIGLTRGFMYAGATRVVASLWKVSDAATAELMERFYRAMEVDRMPPAAALRTAQIQMWRQSRHQSPYFWAAFQIQGDWR